MDIAVKKVEIIEWLIQIKDKHLIEKVEELKKLSIKELYEAKLKPMSPQSYKAMLEQSEKDYKNNRSIAQESLEKESENW